MPQLLRIPALKVNFVFATAKVWLCKASGAEVSNIYMISYLLSYPLSQLYLHLLRDVYAAITLLCSRNKNGTAHFYESALTPALADFLFGKTIPSNAEELATLDHLAKKAGLADWLESSIRKNLASKDQVAKYRELLPWCSDVSRNSIQLSVQDIN